jgi:hypothetical protein
MLLPFIEQSPLYEKIDFKLPSGPYNPNGATGSNGTTSNPLPVPQKTQDVMATKVSTFLCPTDNGPQTFAVGDTTYGQQTVEAAKTNYDFRFIRLKRTWFDGCRGS